MLKKITLYSLCALLFSPLVFANVYITEVMHSPTQVADSEGEWIELFNEGETADLSGWTLDGKAIENVTLPSGAYLVLARELVDSDDADLESFESVWGNNNGVWDEDFLAVQHALSLKEEDSITLTNGVYMETFSYTASMGGLDGKTLERISLEEWREGNGTPGRGSFSHASSPDTAIDIHVTIVNGVPQILLVNMSDDSSAEGVQVMPQLDGAKEVRISVLVNDSDGNVQNVMLDIGNETVPLRLDRNETATAAWYAGSFVMQSTDLAGAYRLTITAFDAETNASVHQNFTYLGIVSTELNVSSFTLDMKAGGVDTRSVQLLNSGNVLIDTEISAEDLVAEHARIPRKSLEIFQDVWLPLENPVFLDLNVAPQASHEIQFRVKLPEDVQAGSYSGRILVTSMESNDAA